MDRTTEFALLVTNGDVLKGELEILACKRHLDDLEKSKLAMWNYYFDVDEAEKHINIANELNIAEGIGSKKFKTRGFQNFIIGSLHGWKKKSDGNNRYREAYIQIARQNGKSILAGSEANSWATFSGYELGRIFCTATKQDQANIVWDEIKKFIESDKELLELYKITEYNRTIKSHITGTVIKAIGKDTSTIDGFRTTLSIVDEYHAHKNNQMYKLVQDGQIDVDTALVLAITTAGFNINGPCHKHYEFCCDVVKGIITKDSQFVFICQPDKDDDIWDPKTWAKANPLLLWNEDNTYNEKKIAVMMESAITAREKGGEELVNFQTKVLNMWVKNGGSRLLNYDKLKKCATDKTLEDMRGRAAYLGIDLSSGGDLTSIVLLFPQDNGKVYIYHHSFMPEQRLQEHIKTDDVPYQVWVDKGLITLTTGGSGIKTDYKFITSHLQEIISTYDLEIIDCGYDPHNAGAYISDLEFLGCDLTEIVQSARSLNDATLDFQLSVEAEEIEYDKNDELLLWSLVNAVITKNSFGEIKIDKQSTYARIDPADGVVDAWKLFFTNKDTLNYNANDDYDDWEMMMAAFKKGR
ncbi:terminase large subunit [Peptostreptococcus equinus]|uniref:Terminase large subunit n=1 Tax=Peptostreptococcus equinus TaxID=3003601 RepID=A0ABY7JRE4_9FIRM|nr:terminase TerL endonuclease subunit [Peptostreptococcus sp. CBA3647]WAW14753.1 terminase large subunit [Peptostreptococcus sp. CBA3647]